PTSSQRSSKRGCSGRSPPVASVCPRMSLPLSYIYRAPKQPMSLVKPCTSMAVWPCYKGLDRRIGAAGEIVLWDSRVLCGPGGDTMTADGAGDPSDYTTVQQFTEERGGV